jgi:Spy/CpxP family protein refolding chaperone
MPTQTLLTMAAGLTIALAVIPTTLSLTAVRAIPAEASQEAELLEWAHQRLLYNVELTSEQKERLQPIFHQAYAQMENLLSPSQITQFQTTLKEGAKLRDAISQMQMSVVQEIQARNILRATVLRAAPIFTPEQRSQIEDNLKLHLEESE